MAHHRKRCQQSTDDRHSFIALGVQFCIQRDGRDVARRAGPSAAAETCSLIGGCCRGLGSHAGDARATHTSKLEVTDLETHSVEALKPVYTCDDKLD